MTSEKIVEVAKRRGFFLQSFGAYSGVSGFYTYGPTGAPLKQNVEDVWRDRFVVREGNQEIDAPTIMPEPVFEASGHLDTFDDMLVACPECEESHRADHLIEDETDLEDAESLPTERVEELIAEHGVVCPTCGSDLEGVPVNDFNLMFGTNIGPGSASPGYLRPETVQGIFVEFPQFKEYARNQLPFGVAQIGRAYRNEISPRKGIVRTREFSQAELELFFDPDSDEPEFVAMMPFTPKNRQVMIGWIAGAPFFSDSGILPATSSALIVCPLSFLINIVVSNAMAGKVSERAAGRGDNILRKMHNLPGYIEDEGL